jgi:hypothetical protein
MNTNLLSIVKQITAQYGETILEDPARLKAFFSDLAKDEPNPLRLAFGRCVEAGAYTALKTEPDAAERAARKTMIAQRVRDEHGIDMTLCAEALDILEAAICTEQTEIPEQPVTVSEQSAQETASAAPPPEPAAGKNLRDMLIVAVIAAVIALLVLYSKYNESQTELSALHATYNNLYTRHEELQTSHGELQTEHREQLALIDSLRKLSIINITGMTVGNWGNGRLLAQSVSGMSTGISIRYLNPYITFSSLITGSKTFFIKILMPDGTVLRNLSVSPAGYSYSREVWVRRGLNSSIDLTGWGSDDGGIYYAGTWTIEIWLDGVRLYSQQVVLL